MVVPLNLVEMCMITVMCNIGLCTSCMITVEPCNCCIHGMRNCGYFGATSVVNYDPNIVRWYAEINRMYIAKNMGRFETEIEILVSFETKIEVRSPMQLDMDITLCWRLTSNSVSS